ncbi:MAG: hypothetical protein ACP5KY_08010 [Thermoproteus sp.]
MTRVRARSGARLAVLLLLIVGVAAGLLASSLQLFRTVPISEDPVTWISVEKVRLGEARLELGSMTPLSYIEAGAKYGA